MKKFMTLRLVEITVIVSIILAGFLIFAYERQHNNLDYQKSWVAFYFATPTNISDGVVIENHLGQNKEFQFCLVADSDKIMEPTDLSCQNSNLDIVSSSKNTIPTGQSQKWQFELPQNSGKYWVVLEYQDMASKEQQKILSFTK